MKLSFGFNRTKRGIKAKYSRYEIKKYTRIAREGQASEVLPPSIELWGCPHLHGFGSPEIETTTQAERRFRVFQLPTFLVCGSGKWLVTDV